MPSKDLIMTDARLALPRKKRVDFSGPIFDNRGTTGKLWNFPEEASKTVAGIDPKYYYLTLGLLIACTIVGLFVAYRLQKDVQVDDAPPTEKEVLGPLEKAYFSGLMTEEEFKRIGHSMAKQKDGPPPSPKPKKAPMTLAEATQPPPSVADADTVTEEDQKS